MNNESTVNRERCVLPGITQTLLRKANINEERGDPLNILTFPTHERYQSNMAKTGHNFYMWQGEHIKTWNPQYAELPHNHYLLNAKKKDSQLPLHVSIDLVLSQNKFGQFRIAKSIAEQIQCPLISLEHTLPLNTWGKDQIAQFKSMRGDKNLFISEYSRGKWGWSPEEGDVLLHGIDTEEFKDNDLERRPVVCSIVNDWANRDVFCGFKLWQKITGHPTPHFALNVWGSTPGLSDPTYSVSHLIEQLNTSLIYLNTSLVSPIPTALLEGMACGCIPISTSNCMIPEIITHGENGFLSNDADELRGYVEKVLKDPNRYKEMGIRARDTIRDLFGLDKFVDNWNKVFYGVIK